VRKREFGKTEIDSPCESRSQLRLWSEPACGDVSADTNPLRMLQKPPFSAASLNTVRFGMPLPMP
jgi:hypothetical protein